MYDIQYLFVMNKEINDFFQDVFFVNVNLN